MFCSECGKINDNAGKFCSNCGKSFIGGDSEVVRRSPVPLSSTSHIHIEDRNLGKMLGLTFITAGFYAGLFYKSISQDINIMSEAVGEMPKLKFNAFFSSAAGFWAWSTIMFLIESTSVGVFFLILLLWIINAIYVMSKAKSMKRQLMHIAPYYYNNYSYQYMSGFFVSTNLGLMAFVGIIFAVFAPMIYANKVIEVFNDIAKQHNTNSAKYNTIDYSKLSEINIASIEKEIESEIERIISTHSNTLNL
jgi:hypothetical protein